MANEKRLIDANEVYELHSNYPMFARSHADLTDLRDILDEATTVDAVEVVRGKDCKHNEDCISRIQFWGRNPVWELNPTEYHPIDFCSYGERRAEDE